jgi:DNA polymerase-3 subunit delta
MKLSARDAKAFLARPDPSCPAALIHGADATRVAMKRADMLAALLGPDAEAEMRLERIDPGEARRAPGAVVDALKAIGFYQGRRAVLIEEAGDGVAPAVSAALDAWAEGDAMLVVTAGALPARGKLRKLVEGHRAAVALPVYDDPPGRDEIEAELRRARVGEIDRSAMADLEALARALDPADFRRTLEKIALYKHGDPAPLTSEEVALNVPATVEAALDEVLAAVAGGREGEIGLLMRKLEGQGVQPVTMVIAAARHFRALHAAAADPAGPAQALGRQRPPIFGPRREAMAAQARQWGIRKLEQALALLTDTDLALRSAGQTAPQMPLVERLFIRLAVMARR